MDVAEAGGRALPRASSAPGFDSDCQEIANATRLPLGKLVYVYATLRALRAWQPAALGGHGRRRAPRRSPATPSRWPTPACSAAGCGSCPTRRSTTACSTSCSPGDRPSARYLRGLAEGVQGHPRRRARASTSCAAREVTFAADRPFTAYADGDPIADLPATVRVLPGRAAGARP